MALRAAFAAGLVFGLATGGYAGQEWVLPREEYYLYRPVPDVLVETVAGRRWLSSLWQERPLLITFAYTRCGGICRPFLGRLHKALEAIGGAGKAYTVVVLSMDPLDSPRSMYQLGQQIQRAHRPGWIWGILAREADIPRLLRGVGYWTRWDSTLQQYDHPSAVIAVSGNGRLVRILVGNEVRSGPLADVVRELRGLWVRAYPLPDSTVAFRCFQYDPDQGWRPDWGLMLLLLPGLLGLGFMFWLFGHRSRQSPG
jgi:cytochrome oxidase Cu insertion factor (SCO1/SenC/PrrC family)|nr:MAG: hypothetical protein KatS3mg041_0245 [Bacteroidota bacterium]